MSDMNSSFVIHFLVFEINFKNRQKNFRTFFGFLSAVCSIEHWDNVSPNMCSIYCLDTPLQPCEGIGSIGQFSSKGGGFELVMFGDKRT